MSAVFHDIKTVDISSISKDEVFAIDTNVLLWTHYAKASNPNLNSHPYQVIEYPDFVADLIKNKNKLVTTTLNISELISIVEKSEYKIYKTMHSSSGMKFKDFRKISLARSDYIWVTVVPGVFWGFSFMRRPAHGNLLLAQHTCRAESRGRKIFPIQLGQNNIFAC